MTISTGAPGRTGAAWSAYHREGFGGQKGILKINDFLAVVAAKLNRLCCWRSDLLTSCSGPRFQVPLE